jgi:hypothetical protein
LTWQNGMGALFHVVYFGESFEDVNEASDPINEGTMVTGNSYTPTLEMNKTYYWRVDASRGATSVKGPVWSFTTLSEIAVTDPNLVLRWTLDEQAGSTAVDWSGHGNHGSLDGPAEWVLDGLYGGALEFYGNSRVIHDVDPAQRWSAFTVALWVKATKTGQRLYSGVFNNDSGGPDFQIDVDGTSPGSYRYYGSAGNALFGPVHQEWIHLAAACDGTNTTLFYNGEQAGVVEGADTNFGQLVIAGNRSDAYRFRGVIDDVYVYDKALTIEEIQGLMPGNTLLAGNPSPGNGAAVDIRDATTLSWTAGETAVSHNVYFGPDEDALELQANQPGTSFSLASLVEFDGGDYYWRIDEVEADGTVQTGYVWTFTIPDYLIVDDFESYTNYSPDRLFQAWIDGIGFSPDEWFPDGNPGNGTCAAVGHDIWSGDSEHLNGTIVESDNPHNGGQAMPLYYDNTVAPYYSKAERTWTTPQDWTVEGGTDLTLYIRGGFKNDPAPMYVMLGDNSGHTATVVHPDAAATAIIGWNEWKIPFTDFTSAGVAMTAVKTMSIGVGDSAATAPGGAGVVYVDDVRVVNP